MLAWITGANGLIGSHLVRLAPRAAPQWTVAGVTRAHFDLTDFDAIRRAFAAQRPQLVLHGAAISSTPFCEANPAVARKVNVEALALLAELSADIPLVFFSSDLVFDGRKGNYVESDVPCPLNRYAQAKLEAEGIVLANPRHTVIRTSLNGGSSPTGDRGFNGELRRAWREGRGVRLFTDEYRSPIPAAVTAQAVWALVEKNQPGLYHLAGSERLSRWQIGQLVAARCPELNPRLEPGSLRDYQGPPRAPDTTLNCARIQKLLPFTLPGLTPWLAEHPEEPF
jgi:dTDP-4-dehydrorhamnose reductase